MPVQPTPAQADDAADPSAPHDEQLLLIELRDIGMDLSRGLPPQSHAQTAALPSATTPADLATLARAAADIATAFERSSRAVRRTILLRRSLDDPAAAPKAQRRAAARRRIIRDVEDAIRQSGTSKPRADTLQDEFNERLERPELDEEIDNRPTPEIITDICRDLGIAGIPGYPSPWKRRTPADIADLCARAAQRPAPTPAAPPTPGAPDEPERFYRLFADP